MAKDIRRLAELDTLEVSLVTKGANKKRFALIKSEGADMDAMIEAVLKVDLEGEDKVDAVLKAEGYSDKAQKAFKAMYKLAAGFKDEMPEGMMKRLAKMCGYGMEEQSATKKSADDLTKLDPETRAQVEALFKAKEQSDAEVVAIKKQLSTERDERRTKEFVAKAAEYKALPGIKTEELGMVLKAVTDATPDHVAKLEAVLKAAAEAIATGEVLKSAGRAVGGFQGGAWAQIQALAGGVVQKSASPMSEAAAIDVVLKTAEGARLYAEYLKENPRQTA